MGGFRPVDVVGARQPCGCEGEQDARGNHAGGDPHGAVARWTGGFGPGVLPERGGRFFGSGVEVVRLLETGHGLAGDGDAGLRARAVVRARPGRPLGDGHRLGVEAGRLHAGGFGGAARLLARPAAHLYPVGGFRGGVCGVELPVQGVAGPREPSRVLLDVNGRGVAHSAIVDTAGITGSLRPVSKCNGASGRGAGYAAGSLGPLLRHVNRAHAQPASGSGSAGTPPTWSWKWRCDPTERPVLPTDPTLWPCWTSSPTLTAVSSMWA